ncbi:MAG: glycosyltransferase [Desulfobacterales bacterium]|nr:glycosyltransferase [Desulfobacterales bacterium]
MGNISLILPTYNERDNIEALIHRIFSALGDAEVIVVDDDSPDRTWQAAQALCNRYPQLKVFRRTHERGLRSAIQAGIDQAEGMFVGWMDCDLSMPPEVFLDMARSSATADLVVGSRYIHGGSDERSFLRRFSSRIINGLGHFLLKTRTRDLTSGFILCRHSLLDQIPLRGNYGEYCIALIFTAERAGWSVLEVPYRFDERKIGQSKTFEGLYSFLFLGATYVRMILTLFREKIVK